MAKRSGGRRSSILNRSSFGSGRLNSDSSILEDEQPLWWNNLTGNTMSQHLNARTSNETSRYLDSNSQINTNSDDPEWWKALEEIEANSSNYNAVIQHKTLSETLLSKGTTVQSKNTTISTSSDSDEDIVKQVFKKKVLLRAKSGKHQSNEFLKALKRSNSRDNSMKLQDIIKNIETNAMSTANENIPSSSILNPKDTSTSSTDYSITMHNIKKKKLNPFLGRFKGKNKNLFAEALRKDSSSPGKILLNNEIINEDVRNNSIQVANELIAENLQKSEMPMNHQLRQESNNLSIKSMHTEQNMINRNARNIGKLNDSIERNILNISKSSKTNSYTKKDLSATDIISKTNKSTTVNRNKSRVSTLSSLEIHSPNISHEYTPHESLSISVTSSDLRTPSKQISNVSMTKNKTESPQQAFKSFSTKKNVSGHHVSEKRIEEEVLYNTKEVPTDISLEEAVEEILNNTKEVQIDNSSKETITEKVQYTTKEEIVNEEILNYTEEVQVGNNSKEITTEKVQHITDEVQMDHNPEDAIGEESLSSTKEYQEQVINTSKKRYLPSTPHETTSTNQQSKSNTKQSNLNNQKKIHEYFKQMSNLKLEMSQALNKKDINFKEKKKCQMDTIAVINKIKQKWKSETELESKGTRKQIDPAYLVNGKVYKPPRLPRPKYWATDRLYKYLWKKMEPKCKLETRVRSEKLIQRLAHLESLAKKSKKYSNYKNVLHSVMKEMAQLGIINTYNDFYDFCYDFMPYEFRIKVVPMMLPGNVENIPYDPNLLHKSLLEE